MNFEKERLLIIAPHADDEILGCFGLIDFIKKNHGKVYVQVLTLGGYAKIGGGQVTKEKWKSEFLDACNFLKIDGYDIGYFDDQIRHLDTIEQSELIDLIEFQSKVSLSKIKLRKYVKTRNSGESNSEAKLSNSNISENKNN